MKSYKNISNRHIFLKKKHFYLTLLGVIMSVALVTAMMTLMYSLVENLHMNEMQSGGAYHLQADGLSVSEANEIKNLQQVESAGIVYETETVSIGQYSEEVAEYYGLKTKMLLITVCDREALQLLPMHPKEGYHPSNPGEIIVDQWFMDNYEGNAGIGDKISLPEIGKSDGKDFDLVISGIIFGGRNISTDTRGKAAILASAEYEYDSSVSIYLRVAQRSSISETKEIIASISPDAVIMEHSSLISLEGRSGRMDVLGPVFSIGLFLTAIIVIATIAVIYNSFNISVLEKTSLYGLLRTTGATPRQIRKMVYREAAFYSCVGIPLGTIIGLAVTYILLEFVGFEPFNLTGNGLSTFISPWFVLAGIAVGIITVYLSAYIPARRAGRVTPVEAISGKKNTKLKNSKHISRRPLLGKIAGLPGTMAAKNLVRNRRKFRVTVFSIVVSSILFIVFNTLVVYSLDVNPYTPIGFDYYVTTNMTTNPGGFSEDDIKYLQELSGFDKVYVHNETGAALDNDQENYNIRIVAYGDKNLSEYFNGSLPENMTEENGCVLIPNYTIKENGKKKVYEAGDFSNGDVIDCQMYDGTEKSFTVTQVHESDFLIPNRPYQLLILISEDTMKRINTDSFIFGIYLSAADNSLLAKDQIEDFVKEKPWYSIIDLSESEQQNKKLSLQLFVFFYGFLSVIIMIGSLNIINTINTSLIQRRREFAILGSVGMTRRQLSRMVLIETLMQGIKAGIIGSAAGTLLTFLLHGLFGNVFDMMEFSIPWGIITVTMAASIGISLLSCIAPMKKLRNQDIIATIRNLE